MCGKTCVSWLEVPWRRGPGGRPRGRRHYGVEAARAACGFFASLGGNPTVPVERSLPAPREMLHDARTRYARTPY